MIIILKKEIVSNSKDICQSNLSCQWEGNLKSGVLPQWLSPGQTAIKGQGQDFNQHMRRLGLKWPDCVYCLYN